MPLSSHITMNEKQTEESAQPPGRTYYPTLNSHVSKEDDEGRVPINGRQEPWRTVDREVPPKEQEQTLVRKISFPGEKRHHKIYKGIVMVVLPNENF